MNTLRRNWDMGLGGVKLTLRGLQVEIRLKPHLLNCESDWFKTIPEEELKGHHHRKLGLSLTVESQLSYINIWKHMEESEAYNNLTPTSEGDESIIQVRIEETKNLFQKLSQEKFEITEKIKEKKFDRNHMCNRLKRLNHHEVEIKDTVFQLRKELDILEVSKDKLHFANNAYQEKPINASFSKQQIHNHKVHYRMLHGTDNIAKEKQLLREIRAGQDSPEDETSMSMQEIQYATWWWLRSLRYEKDEKKAKDGLREIKQHEWERDRTIANATVKGKIWNSLGSKKDLQNQIKGLRTDLDESRKRHLEIRAKITSVKKELKGVDKEINFLKKQFADIDRKKLQANLLIHAQLRGITMPATQVED